MPAHWNPESDYEFATWASTYEARPIAFHRPRSEADVVRIVDAVRTRGGKLRVVGAGHSWSDVVCTSGNMLSLDHLRRVLHIDRERERVTVEAGIRLERLVERLAEEGYALKNLGSVMKQSIAGAISTGTHGTGRRFGGLPQQVVGMRLVTGTSDVLDLDEHDPRLDAARISLGCLGVITRVTLEVEPLYHLRERAWSVPFDWLVKIAPQLLDSAEHVKFWWLPHFDEVQVYALERTDEPQTAVMPGSELVDRLMNDHVFRLILGVGSRAPFLIPGLNHLVGNSYFKRDERVARYDRIFTLAMPPTHLEVEWGVPIEATSAMMRRVRGLIERERLRVSFINEIRFTDADETWLSNAYGRPSCQFGAYTGDNATAQRFFDGVAEIAADYGGRPHWGKQFDITRDELRELYPRFDDFNELRAELDPDGIFENEFVRRCLGSIA